MTDEQDLREVIAEETSWGTRRPHKGLTQHRLRLLRKAANMLTDKRYGREDTLRFFVMASGCKSAQPTIRA